MITDITIRPDTRSSKILFFDHADLTLLPDPHIIPLFGANGAGKSTLLDAIKSDADYRSRKTVIENHIAELRSEQEDDGQDEYLVDKGFTYNVFRSLGSGRDEIEFYREQLVKEQKKRQAECSFSDERYYRCCLYRDSESNFSGNGFLGTKDAYNPVRLSLYYDAESLSEGQSVMYSVKDFLKLLLNDESLHKDGHGLIILLDEIDSGLSLDNIDYVCGKLKRIIRKWDDIQIFLAFNSPEILRYFPYVLSMYDGTVKDLKNADIMREEIKKNKAVLDKARKRSNGEYRIFD